MVSPMPLIAGNKAQLLDAFGEIYVNAPDGFFNEDETPPEERRVYDLLYDQPCLFDR